MGACTRRFKYWAGKLMTNISAPDRLTVTLFHTQGCHLCELAEALLAPWESRGIRVVQVDIAGDDALEDSYGIRIPVVRRDDDARELGWPFDATSLHEFLRPAGRNA